MNFRFFVGVLALLIGFPSLFEASASELDGTSWRLVKIMSMDDSVNEPDDRSKYTLQLQAGGKAILQADCNRGTGTWREETPRQLRFGPIASTRAMCQTGPISEKYLVQFEWVRSYILEGGHLFLATMADGSIIEFEPVANARPTATVLGEEIRTSDKAELQQVILSRLFDRFAAEQSITVKDVEIGAFVEKMGRGMAARGLTAENDLKPEERVEVDAIRRRMGRGIIRQWKINKALYDRYGGRIIYQQFGPEPLDAYRQFLEQRQIEGGFTIHDRSMAESFWGYFKDESIHDFMVPGSANEARAFTIPPWTDQR